MLLEIDEWDEWNGDEQIEDCQTELVRAIAAFEQAQTISTDVHQLCLFEEVASA